MNAIGRVMKPPARPGPRSSVCPCLAEAAAPRLDDEDFQDGSGAPGDGRGDRVAEGADREARTMRR